MTTIFRAQAPALTIFGGDPRVAYFPILLPDGSAQDLDGRAFRFVVRPTRSMTPLLVNVEMQISGDGGYAVAALPSGLCQIIFDAAQVQALSYDVLDVTAGASQVRWTGRIDPQPSAGIDGNAEPVWLDLPWAEVVAGAEVVAVSERGSQGYSAGRQLFAAGLAPSPDAAGVDANIKAKVEAIAAPVAEGAADAQEAARQAALSRLVASQDADRASAAANALEGTIYDTAAEGLAANPAEGAEWRAHTPDDPIYDIGYFKTVSGAAVMLGGVIGSVAVERVLSAVQSNPTEGVAGEVIATEVNGHGFVIRDIFANGGWSGLLGEHNAPGHNERVGVMNALGFLYYESGADGYGVPGGNFEVSTRALLEVANRHGFVAHETVDGGLAVGRSTIGEVTSIGLFLVANMHGFVPFEIGFDGMMNGDSGDPVVPETPFDPAPLLGDRLCLPPVQPLMLYTNQIFGAVAEPGHVLVTIASDGPRGPLVISGSDTILLDPGAIGGTIDLTARAIGSANAKRVTMAVSKGAGSGAPKVALIGDSITNRQTAYFANDRLTGWGYAPNWIGTMNGSVSDSSNGNAGGPLGEGREGWALSDYLYTDLDGEAAPLAVGGEAAYLASAKASKLPVNPFIRAATGGDDPAIVHNGYVFDYAFYLVRFGLATPDVIVVGLGMNDVLEETAEQARSQIVTLGAEMLRSIRAAAPAAKIGVWFPPISRLASTDGRIGAVEGIDVVRAWLEVVTALADPNIELINMHALITTETGDAASGSPLVATDIVHPIGLKRRQLANVISSFIAARAA